MNLGKFWVLSIIDGNGEHYIYLRKSFPTIVLMISGERDPCILRRANGIEAILIVIRDPTYARFSQAGNPFDLPTILFESFKPNFEESVPQTAVRSREKV